MEDSACTLPSARELLLSTSNQQHDAKLAQDSSGPTDRMVIDEPFDPRESNHHPQGKLD